MSKINRKKRHLAILRSQRRKAKLARLVEKYRAARSKDVRQRLAEKIAAVAPQRLLEPAAETK